MGCFVVVLYARRKSDVFLRQCGVWRGPAVAAESASRSDRLCVSEFRSMDQWVDARSDDPSLPPHLRQLRDQFSQFRAVNSAPSSSLTSFVSQPKHTTLDEKTLEDLALDLHQNVANFCRGQNWTMACASRQKEDARRDLEINQADWYLGLVDKLPKEYFVERKVSPEIENEGRKGPRAKKVTFNDEKQLVASFRNDTDLERLRQEQFQLHNLEVKKEEERRQMELELKRVANEEKMRQMQIAEAQRQEIVAEQQRLLEYQRRQAARDPIEVALEEQRRYLRHGRVQQHEDSDSETHADPEPTRRAKTVVFVEPPIAPTSQTAPQPNTAKSNPRAVAGGGQSVIPLRVSQHGDHIDNRPTANAIATEPSRTAHWAGGEHAPTEHRVKAAAETLPIPPPQPQPSPLAKQSKASVPPSVPKKYLEVPVQHLYSRKWF